MHTNRSAMNGQLQLHGYTEDLGTPRSTSKEGCALCGVALKYGGLCGVRNYCHSIAPSSVHETILGHSRSAGYGYQLRAIRTENTIGHLA